MPDPHVPGVFYSLNNRRLYVFKQLCAEGLLSSIEVRVREMKEHERTRYTVEKCALQARYMYAVGGKGGGAGGAGGGPGGGGGGAGGSGSVNPSGHGSERGTKEEFRGKTSRERERRESASRRDEVGDGEELRLLNEKEAAGTMALEEARRLMFLRKAVKAREMALEEEDEEEERGRRKRSGRKGKE